MLQVIQDVAKNPEDKTEVSFIFANKTEEDIILRKELDDLAQRHSNIKVIAVAVSSVSPQETIPSSPCQSGNTAVCETFYGTTALDLSQHVHWLCICRYSTP